MQRGASSFTGTAALVLPALVLFMLAGGPAITTGIAGFGLFAVLVLANRVDASVKNAKYRRRR